MPNRILKTSTMSVSSRLALIVGMSISISLVAYEVPFRPETMLTALFCTLSRHSSPGHCPWALCHHRKFEMGPDVQFVQFHKGPRGHGNEMPGWSGPGQHWLLWPPLRIGHFVSASCSQIHQCTRALGTLHLAALKAMPNLVAHAISASRHCCSCRQSFLFLIMFAAFVLSANLISIVISSTISLCHWCTQSKGPVLAGFPGAPQTWRLPSLLTHHWLQRVGDIPPAISKSKHGSCRLFEVLPDVPW